MTHTFYIADVFAEAKFAGNQLAVIRGAADLTDGTMQKIAREMHFSETTFILSDDPRDEGYDVRIFTPASEIPFAGHPTLGTAYIIQHEIDPAPFDTIVLNLRVGRIPVTFEGDSLWMKQLPPTFGQTRSPDQLAPVLYLDVNDFDLRFPIQEVSTGLPFLIVPLKNLNAVRRAHINLELLGRLITSLDAKMIFLFSPETYHPENELNARMFGDEYGVSEDPATGSANGCLAGYLVKYAFFGRGEISVRVEQGYEIPRPSLLLLRAKESDGKIDVSVGGKVFIVAKGELL